MIVGEPARICKYSYAKVYDKPSATVAKTMAANRKAERHPRMLPSGRPDEWAGSLRGSRADMTLRLSPAGELRD